MKVKEPLLRYNAVPSTSIMRGRLIKALENEEDTNFIQNMYVMMIQLQNDRTSKPKHKYSLSELKGILSLENDNCESYDDIRNTYLREKYSL